MHVLYFTISNYVPTTVQNRLMIKTKMNNVKFASLNWNWFICTVQYFLIAFMVKLNIAKNILIWHSVRWSGKNTPEESKSYFIRLPITPKYRSIVLQIDLSIFSLSENPCSTSFDMIPASLTKPNRDSPKLALSISTWHVAQIENCRLMYWWFCSCFVLHQMAVCRH